MPLKVSCAAEGLLGSTDSYVPNSQDCSQTRTAPALCGSSVHSCMMQSLRSGGLRT